MKSRSLGVMQPYVFPYVGYFHLIEATDRFVFYDDVSYRPRTWMNRNRILLAGVPHTFTVPVRGGSQNALVRDVEVLIDDRWRRKFESTLAQAYRSAPYYRDVAPLLSAVLAASTGLTELAISSIELVYDYVGKPLRYNRSSLCSPESIDLGRAERLIHLTRRLGCDRYVNLAGGRALYNEDVFRAGGVELRFVKSRPFAYEQGLGGSFVRDLSVIDLLMFNDPTSVREAMAAFEVTT